jgi:phosphopantothenoylcysteine decarboxylase
VLPPADAVIVAPATVNTINKWAAGICDTLALGILVEAIGMELPVVAVPFSNRAHAAHPAFTENVARLRSWGVTVLYDPGAATPHDPGAGDGQPLQFPWQQAIDAVPAAGGISASRG